MSKLNNNQIIEGVKIIPAKMKNPKVNLFLENIILSIKFLLINSWFIAFLDNASTSRICIIESNLFIPPLK